MSRKKDYLQKLNTKNKQHKKKKHNKLHCSKEAINDTNLYGENITPDQRETVTETSENAAPLLEIDNNAESLPRQKKKLHKRKQAKDQSDQFIHWQNKQAQLQESTENPLLRDYYSNKKRKRHQSEEELEKHEVTEDKEDRHTKKRRKKEQRLKEAEHCLDLCGENDNVGDEVTASESLDQAAHLFKLDNDAKRHTRQRRKKNKRKVNAEVTADNTSSENNNTVKKPSYLERIKQDPIKREQFYIKRREQAKKGRMRFKEILNGTIKEEDPVKAELIAIRIKLREEQIKRRNIKRREKAEQLKESKQLLKEKKDKSETMTETDASRDPELADTDNLSRYVNKLQVAKTSRVKRRKKPQQLNENNYFSETMTETHTSRVSEPDDTENLTREVTNLQIANTPNVPRPQNKLPVKQPERRKAKNTIADFTVDSADSITNLIDYFERKNMPLYRVYRRMMGKLNERNCTESPHFFLPGLPLNSFSEDFDGSLPSRYFEKFAYKCTMPCVTTRLKNLEYKDPLTHTMSVKKNWKTDVYFGVKGANKAKVVEKTKKLNDKVYSCPEHLVRLAELLDHDPDPYFNDGYNWYYAGNGNLQVISVNDTDCLLHSQLNRLYLSKFSRRKLITKNTPLACYDCGEKNNILETICNINSYIAIRLKHKIYILKLTTEANALTFQHIKEIDSKIPFASIEFDNYQKNILYITKLDGSLSIVNLDLMKCRTLELMTGASMENNWNKVITVDQISYCHVSRETLKIYDKRTNRVVYEFTDLKSKHSELECDDISAIQKCEDVPFAFLATSHSMFLMDLRWQGIHKPRLLRQWKHHMQNVPTYISQIKQDIYKDLICLSSQWPEDTCLISNDIDIYDKILQPTSMTLPYGLPTFETSLNAAKNRMLCVDIYHPLEQRIYTSVSGNCVMAADENVLLLTLNTLGDIFAYTLYPEHLDKDDDNLERLHEWGSTMTREKRMYDSSKVIDIGHVWKALMQVPSDYVIGDRELNGGPESKFDEQAVHDMCNSGEIDAALLDAWLDDEKEDTKVEDTALNIDLHFSDSE